MTSRALEFRERRLRQVRGAQVLAAAGGLTTLVAGGYLIDEFSPGALVGALAGLAVLAGGVTLAGRLGQTVRYRIDRPNSTLVLAARIAALVAVFFGVVAVLSAVDAPSAPRSVIVVVVVGSLAAIVNAHASRWTLFQVDATGLRVGRAGVPWPAVARIDVAAAGQDAAEIGVQLVPGQVVNGTPVPGRVLSDLPVCTLVPAAALRLDRLGWAVREFGNPAVPVVARDQPRPPTPPATPGPIAPQPPPPGYQPPTQTEMVHRAVPLAQTPPVHVVDAVPEASVDGDSACANTTTAQPRRRRPWLIAGAIALAAVLMAGAVVVVTLTGNDHEPGATAGQQKPRYSAAAIGEPCDLIDVHVLERWSTETEIVTEPHQGTHPDYDYVQCSAHSDSEYVVGRVTHLELYVAVAEDARAARAFAAKEKDRGGWTVTGDVREEGTVDDLGESAEYEQAITTYSGHTRADHVLRLRDDNLVFFLRYGSDADQSDGDGVTVRTLADSARQQARVAMEKLRDRPEQKERPENDEPAAVPETINDAATLPGTAALMARIRAADACELHDRTAMATYGTRIETEPRQALGLAECVLMVVVGKDRIRFRIDLNEYLSNEERVNLTREKLKDLELFRTTEVEGSNSCTYYVPFGRSGFGASVQVLRYVPGAANQGPWPRVCEVAGDYAAAVGAKIAELPARSTPAPEPTLIGKDPCLADEVAESLLPGWQLGEISRYYSAHCRFTVKQGDETYEIEMDFDRDAEQLGDEPASVGGLTGVWIKYEGLCTLSLVYVPETTPDTWDAHNIGVSVQLTGGTGSKDVCAVAQGAAELLVSGL